MLPSSSIEFENFLRLSPWPAAVMEATGELKYANGAFAQLIGKSEIQLLGQQAGYWLKPIDEATPLLEFLEDMPSDHAWQGKVQVLDHQKWTPTSFLVQKNPSKPEQIFLYSIEAPVVNGRRLMTSKSELRILQILMDNSLDYVFFKDTRGRYVLTNRAYQEFLNVPYEGYEIGRGVADFTDVETARQSDQDDRKALSSGKPLVNHLIRHVGKDGSWRWLQATKVPVYDSDGCALGIVCIARDVTVEKEREEALVRARKNAEKANKAKSQFLANMSHEIRTPLNGIIGMAELCRDIETNSEQSGYVETILMCGSTLLSLVNDVLDFSKIEAGLFTLDKTKFNLIGALEETVGTFHAQANNSGVELVTRIDPSVPDYFIGDEKRFKQIIYNIVGNALKFTSDGTVCVDLAEIESNAHESRILLTVRDTGIGIPASRQVEIFDTFTQVDMTTTREFGGTGLGLAICREIAHHMGGQIYVSSQEGEGTTFGVYLNLFKATQDSRYREKEFAEYDGLTVLIADRSDEVCSMISATMQFYGFHPKTLTSHSLLTQELQDLEAEKEEGSALLIADQEWLHRALRENSNDVRLRTRLSRLPTITTTGEFSGVSSKNHTEGEISLSKPIRRADLLNAVTIVLNESKTRDIRPFIEREPEIPLSSPSEQSEWSKVEIFKNKEKGNPFKILLVEDNAINQQVAVKRIGRMGFEVEVAENGEDALHLFRAKDYDAILMDVQMPVMDGFQATRKIREFEESRVYHTPVIAMTARALQGDRERCLQAGMDYYLAKPFRAAIFEKMLEDNQLVQIMTENRKLRESRERSGDEVSDLAKHIAVTFASLDDQDREGFRDAADIFILAAGDEKGELQQQFFEENFMGMLQKAHSLKGIISIFGATPLVAILQKIEKLASEEDLPGLKASFNEFWTPYDSLAEILKQYVISNS
ncbi:MAG: ATP-binding protein [Opitutales bacterium]